MVKKEAVTDYDEPAPVLKDEPEYQGRKIYYAAYQKAKALVALDLMIKDMELRIM